MVRVVIYGEKPTDIEGLEKMLCEILTENRRTECFLNADGTYNFNNDKNAQACLELAKKYGEEASASFINGVLASVVKDNNITEKEVSAFATPLFLRLKF